MLSNKVAIVTGGARGIGRAIALELARHGANVSICDVCARAGAEDAIREIEAVGRTALYIQADVANRAAVEGLIAETVGRFGRIDILVNNAARSIRKPLLELEIGDVEAAWNPILWGAFHCSQLAARRMVAQGEGGNLVMISSVHAYRPYPNSSPCNGAKAALNQMAATWAAELAQYRIRVNSIEPGWTDTPGERVFFTEEQLAEGGRKLPLGRLAGGNRKGRALPGLRRRFLYHWKLLTRRWRIRVAALAANRLLTLGDGTTRGRYRCKSIPALLLCSASPK